MLKDVHVELGQSQFGRHVNHKLRVTEYVKGKQPTVDFGFIDDPPTLEIGCTVTKYIPAKDDDYQPGPYETLTLMGLTKSGRYKKKKKEKFLDPVTGLGLSDDEDPDNWYWKDGKKQHRKRLKLGIICRGPGCNCKTKFGNKTRLRDHYIEMGCYSCKRPGCMIRLGFPNITKSGCLWESSC